MTATNDPGQILDALAHEVGLGAADSDAQLTPKQVKDADEVIAFARRELAKHARADVPHVVPLERPVRASILAMSRDAIVTRLRELQAALGATQLAVSHRHFTGAASDDDLRSVLEDLETLFEQREATR